MPVPPPDLPPGRVVLVPDRGEVFVREAGSATGPTIVLLHGWTASADLNWWRAYPTLARMRRVIAVDHRGHGRGIRTDEQFTLEDAADDVAGVLGALDAGPAIVVGYSMGGPIALLTWLRHQHLVSGIVLQATAMEWRATLRERAVWRFMTAVEWFLRLGRPKGLLEHALRDMVKRSPDVEPYLSWLRGELRRGDPEALADAGRALGKYDFRPFASTVDVPTAVVATTRDRLVRPKKQHELTKAIPNARTFTLDGDHDAALVLGDAFARVTADAVRWVDERASAYALEVRRTAG